MFMAGPGETSNEQSHAESHLIYLVLAGIFENAVESKLCIIHTAGLSRGHRVLDK